MAEEVIFLQTDPTFNLVLLAMRQLRDKGRVPVDRTTLQSAFIRRIERAVRGANDNCYRWKQLYHFARTAGVCFRMTMLEATGIPQEVWPQTKSFPPNTREGNMGHDQDPMPFQLAETEDNAKRYWSKYDQLYPHAIITKKYEETEEGQSVPLNSMMVIFRNDFREMIEITTTVRLTKRAVEYDASVHVLCVRREIDPGNDENTPAFKQLQEICMGEQADRAEDIHEDFITEATRRMDELII